ncbi:hypothetical protein BGX24_007689, partial [Mortierella sp. AD032]
FGEEEFSVGLVNTNTQQFELIPNKNNETITLSYVRIVKFLDGTQETTVGKDALYRPLDEREKAVARVSRAKLDQWYTQERNDNNSSIPDPEFTYGFQPDEAYGLGLPSSYRVGLPGRALASLQSIAKRAHFEYEKRGGMGAGFTFGSEIVGSEWNDGLPKLKCMSHHSDYNATGKYVQTSEQLEGIEKKRRREFREYENRQAVAKILLEKVKEMAETRLSATVKHV